MNISFNTYNSINKTGAVTGTGSVGKTDAAVNISGKVKADVVSISSDATDYSGINKVRSSVADGVNECGSSERIAALKQAVANGSYNVPSEAIAGKILDRFV